MRSTSGLTCGNLSGRDGGVRRDPGVELPAGRAVRGSRGVGLLNRLVVEGDLSTQARGQDGGGFGQGECLRPGQGVGLVDVFVRCLQHDGRHISHVVPRHAGDPPLARRAADDPALVHQEGKEVEVEVVAQERVRHAGRGDAFLGTAMVATERERGLLARAGERGVDEVLHPRSHRALDEGVVLAPAGARSPPPRSSGQHRRLRAPCGRPRCRCTSRPRPRCWAAAGPARGPVPEVFGGSPPRRAERRCGHPDRRSIR